MTTLIYCRAGDEIGMGHAVRCGHLAKVLRDAGEDVAMMILKGEPTKEYFKSLGLQIFVSGDDMLADSDVSADRWIVDMMVNDDQLLRRLRPETKQLVVIVGVGYSITRDTHWIADQVVYQAPTSRFDGVPGEEVIAGLDHIIIDPAYAEEPEDERSLDVVSYFGGGFDRTTRDTMRNLIEAMPNTRRKYLNNWPDGIREDMRRARFFVGSMGMAVYEALAAGTFPVVVCRSEDHTIPAMRLESQGRLVLLGTADQVSPNVISRKITELLQSRHHFPKVRPVDGLGVYRVARKILEWQPLRH